MNRILGQLEPLTLTSSKPRQWFVRFNIFASTNQLLTVVPEVLENGTAADIANNQRDIAAANMANTQLFLTYVDGPMFSLINSLCSPHLVTSKSVTELQDLICEHLEPKNTKYTQRYLFSKTIQKPGQSIHEYIAQLRTIAEDCEFQGEYESRLLDQFLSGMSSNKLKKKLLSGTEELRLQNVLQRAVAEEQADKEAQIMTTGESSRSDTHKVNLSKGKFKKKGNKANATNVKPKEKPATVICSKCKLAGHYANVCKTRCFKCKVVGHSTKNCYRKAAKGSSTHHVEGSDSSDESHLLSNEYECVKSEGNTDSYPIVMHQTELAPTTTLSSYNYT